MQNGLYVSLSAQVALERRLETIADNVANMNTVGYRATACRFEAAFAKAGDDQLAYVSRGSDFISRRSGAVDQDRQSARFRRAGRRLVRDPDARQASSIRATAACRSTNAGELQTLNGYPVLDAGGAPILLDPNAGPPTIARDGMITPERHAGRRDRPLRDRRRRAS